MEYNGMCSSTEMAYKMTSNHANNSRNACWKAQVSKASEAYYTRDMQGDAQMTKPTPNRSYVAQNSSKMSWDDGFERHKNGAHAMAHK